MRCAGEARSLHGRLDGHAHLGGLAHRLDDERIHARFGEGARLVAESALHLRKVGGARFAEEVAARSDGAEDVGAA
jgi:hypothetical protein